MHLAFVQRFHGPLIAFAVAMSLIAGGRFLRLGLLTAAAGGAGVIAGWFAITCQPWTTLPRASMDDLTALAAIAVLIAVHCAWMGSGRHEWIGMLIAAVACAWMLSGAPRSLVALRSSWPIALGVAAAILLSIRALAAGGPDPLRLSLSGLTLAAAMCVAGNPPIWTQLALVPGVAALAMFALPQTPTAAALPIAVDVAAAGSLAALSTGRLPRLGFALADAAVLSPLLAIWLQPRTVERMHTMGPMAPLAGSLLAGAIAVGCVWLARQGLGH